MPKPPIVLPELLPDGTSQAARHRRDRLPETIRIDDRGVADHLRAAKALAGRLLYYDTAGMRAFLQRGELPEATWADFLAGIGPPATGAAGAAADITFEQAAAFVASPETFDGLGTEPLRRPHVLLFLTFLHLLRHGQDAVNGLVGRHLEFYYRSVLGLSAQPAVPDRVFVLFEPASGVGFADVADGTLLFAGRDAAGRDRRYRVVTRPAVTAAAPVAAAPSAAATAAGPVPDLIVSRAGIERLSAVHAHIRRLGIADARRVTIGTLGEQVLAMVEIALGDPDPGDSLPDYGGQPVDFGRLQALAAVAAFSEDSLHLELFELRLLVTTKQRRDQADGDWEDINRLLQTAGRAMRQDPGWTLEPADPRDFEANLEAALGLTAALFNTAAWFGGLTQVEDLDDLYTERHRQEVRDAIEEKLFLSLDDFIALMDLKRASDADWAVINGLLEQAGKRKNGPAFVLDPADPTDFQVNFTDALAPVDFQSIGIGDIDGYHAELISIEDYFYMSVEVFLSMMSVLQKSTLTPSDWDLVDATLLAAYERKVYHTRRQRLKRLREAVSAGAEANAEAEGLSAILADVLGPGREPRVDALEAFLSRGDLEQLQSIADRVDTGALSDDDWDQAYAIAERAKRQREQLPRPVPAKEEWRNLFVDADATAAVVQAFGAEADDLPRWKLFGRPVDGPSVDLPPPEQIGLAIGSPALRLSGGDRDIRLTLGFHPGQDGVAELDGLALFRVLLSTEAGWIEPDAVTALEAVEAYADLPGVAAAPNPPLDAVRLTITLPADAEPVAPPPAEAALPGCPWPAIKLMLKQLPPSAGGPSPYARLRGLRLARVHLEVITGSGPDLPDRQGLAPLFIENDDTVLNGKKPFLPFGHSPAAGSRLFVGHPDLFDKHLRTLTFHLHWMGGPEDLTGWYQAYDLPVGFAFRASVDLIDRRATISDEAPASALFAGDTQDATAPHVIEVTVSDHQPAPYDPTALAARSAEVRSWDRYLRWTLAAPDFQHGVYPSVAARKSLELAAAIANKTDSTTINAAEYQVHPPYTPKLTSLTLDVRAAHEIDVAAYQPGPATDQVFHIHPFGAAEVTGPVVAADGLAVVPRYDEEGEFTIGLSRVVPPQSLAILFQLADGSADPDLPRQPVRWSYLDGNRWRAFEAEGIVQDTTRGLINAGIIEFRLPAVAPSTLMPRELYWLRAVIGRDSGSVCDAVAVHPNAAVAVFEDDGNDPSHYDTPLPPGSVVAPVRPLRTIGAVHQPYTSFGGRPPEADAAFYTRVSERLRHKQRALTPWDYERLVLAQFPQVYKAKCLPADPADGAEGVGHVRLVVIPDMRNRRPFDPFQPKPSADLIAEIESFLASRIPSTVRLTVMNPVYVPVQIRVGVRFREAGNDDYFKAKLTAELNRFLSPWAYEDGADIIIGRRIYANSVVSFLDQRPYVDFVAGIKLFSLEDGEARLAPPPSRPEDGYFVKTDLPWGILVAARDHAIDVIGEDVFEEKLFTGIGYMRIELDFVVA